MWSHSQPHLYDNVTLLETEMRLNREFAKVRNVAEGERGVGEWRG